uniref:EF-hand domain-containing protein n=1 Tax=Schistosoma haematobium TaxID=6185 RepID=A0A095ALK1_SCHHA
MVFENFDENKDNILSHTERLKLKASLEEQKIALVSELTKEERLNLDAKQPGTSQSKMAPTTQIKIDIKQAEFMQLYKRVNRIENGMGQVIGHIEDVLKSLATLEKIKVIRRETMTQFLQTIISVRKGFVDMIVILIIEIMSQLKLDHHGKPGNSGWSFRPTVGRPVHSGFPWWSSFN